MEVIPEYEQAEWGACKVGMSDKTYFSPVHLSVGCPSIQCCPKKQSAYVDINTVLEYQQRGLGMAVTSGKYKSCLSLISFHIHISAMSYQRLRGLGMSIMSCIYESCLSLIIIDVHISATPDQRLRLGIPRGSLTHKICLFPNIFDIHV